MDNHVLGFLVVTITTYIIIQMLIGRATNKIRKARRR